MELQQITLLLPLEDRNIAEKIENYTAEENLLMLEIGANAINKIKQEMNGDEQENISRIRESIAQSFRNKLTELTAKCELLKEEIQTSNDKMCKLTAERDTQQLRAEVEYGEKMREKMAEMIAEKEKTEERLAEIRKRNDEELSKKRQEMLEMSQITTKVLEGKIIELQRNLEAKERELNEFRNAERENSERKFEEMRTQIIALGDRKLNNIVKGDEGELMFYELAKRTFQDYKDFNIIDTSNIPNMGDFHLIFENFTIMVDCKNYSNKVNNISREKLKNDLRKNPHIKIGWIVSINTPILKFSRCPFMIEPDELDNGLCVGYVNSLFAQPNPEEALKQYQYECSILYEKVIMREENESIEFNSIKEENVRMKDVGKRMEIISKNGKLLRSQLEKNSREMEECIEQIMQNNSCTIQSKNYTVVNEWWNEHFEKSFGERLKSKTLFQKIKEDIIGFTILEEDFKDIIEIIVGKDNVQRQKYKSSPLVVLGFRIKS